MNLESLTIKDARSLMDSGKISSLDLSKLFLDRIKKIDPKINSCISVFYDQALDEAKLADKRMAEGEKGDLLGIPYLLKDNILAKGQKTTAASKMLENYIAPYDATVVKKLKEAGAVLLGKTNLDEFAHGASTENSAFFTTKNPWDLERVPGGSSGGSAAAVSAGFCIFALGSDTGGSIRQPASFCGVTGLKPSYGRVSRFGLISMTSSTDVIGPITKNVEDAAIVLKYISGEDNFDFTTSKKNIEDYTKFLDRDISNLKIGVLSDVFNDSLDENIKDAFLSSLDFFKKEGAKIIDIKLDYNKYSIPVYYIITPSELSSNLARLDGIRYGFSWKFSPKGQSLENLNEIYLKNRGHSFGPEVKRRIMLGTYALSSGYYDAYYKKAILVKEMIKKEFDQAFKKVDIILSPTSPHTAFKIGEKCNDPLKMYLEDIFVTGPSLAGLPAISIPLGFSNKLPFGLQIFSNKFEESLIFNLAYKYQKYNNCQDFQKDL